MKPENEVNMIVGTAPAGVELTWGDLPPLTLPAPTKIEIITGDRSFPNVEVVSPKPEQLITDTHYQGFEIKPRMRLSFKVIRSTWFHPQ